MTGDLFIITAPSGAGKTSLVNALLQQSENMALSVSHTTRPKRPGERHAIDYYFINDDEFRSLQSENAFLEHANVFGYHYGTSKNKVKEQLASDLDVILEIDWQGAEQIKQHFAQSLAPKAISIFILPPSRDVLQERLHNRGQDSPEVIANRLSSAHTDMQQLRLQHFDYWVVNNDFQTALADLRAIVRSERLRKARQLHQLKPLLDSWEI